MNINQNFKLRKPTYADHGKLLRIKDKEKNP